MLWSIILAVICSMVAVLMYYWYSYKSRLFMKVPGPKPLFLFGHAFLGIQHSDDLFSLMRTLKNYGPISKLLAANIRLLNIYDHADIETIMSSVKYNEKGKPYTFFEPWLRKGLLISNGEHWLQRRKLLTPTFHFNILKIFFKTFVEQTDQFLKVLEKEAENEYTSIQPLVTKFTLRVICETAMGTNMNEGIDSVSEKYHDALVKIGQSFVYRTARPHLFVEWLFKLTKEGREQNQILKELHGFTKKIIRERKEYRKVMKNNNNSMKAQGEEIFGQKVRLGMLDLLLDLERSGDIDEDGVCEEVDTFMFEGNDTMSATLTFMTMRIANEPEVQEKIYSELKEIFGESRRPPTLDDLSRMKYLERCIKESMRLYPSVPSIARLLTEEVVLGGYRIPSGTVVAVHIFDVHRDASIYPEPERFLPERFLPEHVVNRHPYAYLPFSAGSRNCIGQKFAMLEMKTLMSGVLRRYRLSPVTRPQDLTFITDMVLRSAKPIYVRFHRRDLPSRTDDIK